jgi:hypothetical protein
MEATKMESGTHSYESPAVVYEATLVAYAGTLASPCLSSGGDLLDPTAGQ